MNRNILNGKLKFLFVSMFLLAATNIFALDFSQSPNVVSNAGTMFFSKLNSAEPQISTLKSGDTVIIGGQGFDKFEMVSLSVENYDELLSKDTALMRWNVYADEKGGFEVRLPIDSLTSTNGRFVVRAFGTETKSYSESNFSTLLPNPSADLDQCANGSFASPKQCTGSNWQNGNVGQNDGHYYEGDSIPYRVLFDNLSTSGSHTFTMEWDTTKGVKHAIDYLTSYNRTEMVGNNPCSGVSPACGAATTFPIPLDPNVSNAGVTQVGGQVFTMWGGTITGVSAYTRSGPYTSDSSTKITLTFTASQANPVLAWSGHIANRNDWATMGGSASDINGSPYHTRVLELDGSGGNQDRSLSNVAVRLNSKIVIIKDAQPDSATPFGFTSNIPANATFTLWDDGVSNDATPNSLTFENLLASGSGSFTVTENAPTNFYQLQSIVCTVGTGGTSTTMISVPTRTATINLNYGDLVTCTFTNVVPTAASTYVRGRILSNGGLPISRTLVTIQNVNTGEIQRTLSNSFGYYRFDDLEVGNFYIVTVENRKYVFTPNSASFTLNDAVESLDFTSSSW